jgi:predicted nucleic acid-binding protein
VRYTADFAGEIVTTEWVLNEFANFLAKPPNRQLFVSMIQELRADPRVVIVAASEATFEAGFTLYSARLDKEWSLTDCVSFLVMKDRGINDALTKDHHFEQAGFHCLLK